MPLPAREPPVARPRHVRPHPGHHRLGRSQRNRVGRRAAQLAAQEARDAVRRHIARPRPDPDREHVARRQRRDQHVVHARNALESLDPGPARGHGGPYQRGEYWSRQVQRREAAMEQVAIQAVENL